MYGHMYSGLEVEINCFKPWNMKSDKPRCFWQVPTTCILMCFGKESLTNIAHYNTYTIERPCVFYGHMYSGLGVWDEYDLLQNMKHEKW